MVRRVRAPYARIGDNGRVLHTWDCPRVASAALPTFLTREEALRFLAMLGRRRCPTCAPDVGGTGV